MTRSEVARILTDPGRGCLVSGQDALCRRALLRAEFAQSVYRRQIHIVIAPEERTDEITAFLRAAGLRQRGTLPDYTASYFPAFTPTAGEERMERLLALLRLRGMEEEQIERAYGYFLLICDLEERLNGREVPFDAALLERYGRISAVEAALDRLALSPLEQRCWLERYAEAAPIAPLIENFLRGLQPVFFLRSRRRQTITRLEGGDSLVFILRRNMDGLRRKLLLQSIAWDIADARAMGKAVVVSVVEGRTKYGEEMALFLEQICGAARVVFYTDDLFAHPEGLRQAIEGYFECFIYSWHTSMDSCGQISRRCGEIPIVRTTCSEDRDRRLLDNNRLIDRIFNTNRTDHYTEHTPVWEPRYRQEEIRDLPPGTCLIRTRQDTFFESLVGI